MTAAAGSRLPPHLQARVSSSLSCYSRIIDPLASRCSKFRFKPLDTASMLARLQHICREEKIDVSDEVGCAVRASLRLL